ncbi:MAG: diguanylate cyclase [Tissierellaceae bacterium]|nr:diguanylate cyclase [Tissierellaceae bacterium]
MKFINNRFKIVTILHHSTKDDLYVVEDLWNNEEKKFLKFFNYEEHGKLIDYLTENFIFISSIKHKYLLSCEQFDICRTIDRSTVNINKYYYVSEYIDASTLAQIRDELSVKDKVFILIQLCVVLNFLHFRGITYKSLNPENIYVLKNREIKLRNLISTFEDNLENEYGKNTNQFILSETLLKEKSKDIKTDFYFLGMIIKYLFPDEILEKGQFQVIENVYDNLVESNKDGKDINLSHIVNKLSSAFHIRYEYDLRKERETINFKTKMVGQSEELKRVLQICGDYRGRRCNKKIVLVSGEPGVGKTRFLKEVSYRLKIKGIDVYNSYITKKENESFKVIRDILRQAIKGIPKSLLDKYGGELVKILPELNLAKDIVPTPSLGENEDKFRLYDRLLNLMDGLSKIKSLNIVIDNIHYSDIETLTIIDYILKSPKEFSIAFILSDSGDKISDSNVSKFLEEWRAKGYIEDIKLSKLGLQEIGELVQYILGMSFKPLNFSASLLKETLGSPRFIELILYDLCSKGELRINERGNWDLINKTYSEIYLPVSFDNTLKEQLNSLDDDSLYVLKIISIFNNPVSKNSIIKMVNMDVNRLNEIVDKLVKADFVDERVGDWGYSYIVYDLKLKKMIYYSIDPIQKKELHKKSAVILEEEYKSNKNIDLEELIYHLIQSDQMDKAIDYTIDYAEEMESLLNSQSVLFWEKAYDLLKDRKDERKLRVLESIGRLYILRYQNEKALKVYKQLLEEAEQYNSVKYIVDSKNSIAQIYYKKNDLDSAFKYSFSAKNIAKDVNNIEGLLNSIISLSKIEIYKGNYDSASKELLAGLEISEREKAEKNTGYFYNLLGIIDYYSGNMEKAEKNFLKSIEYFERTEDYVEFIKPLNNMANVYIEYYGDIDKAIEYYNKGLNISRKIGDLDLEMTFLNNVGEIYIGNHDYENGKKYIRKTKEIAENIENGNMLFLSNINLGNIYLTTGEYDLCYNCYRELQQGYIKNPNKEKEALGQYFNFMGEFYYTFGMWKKSLKNTYRAIQMCKEFDMRDYLLSKIRIILIKYYDQSKFDKEHIEEIRKEFRKRKYNFDRRKALLQFSTIAILEGDLDYAYNLLKEDEDLVQKYHKDSLDFIRNLLLYYLDENNGDSSKLMYLENEMKNNDILYFEFYGNFIIADKFYQLGDYYKSLKFYTETLDVLYRLTIKIPDKKFQIQYIKINRGNEIKQKMKSIFKEIFKKDIPYICLEDLEKEDSIEKYFEFEKISELIDNDCLRKMLGNSTDLQFTNKIKNLEDLIVNFTDNYKENLHLILEYLAEKTIAQKGFIFSYDEKNKDLSLVVSLNSKDSDIIDENILKIIGENSTGVIIKNTPKELKKKFFTESLSKENKAFICVPVYKPNGYINNFVHKDRRKHNLKNEKIIGYIYLQTDKLFNRFDYERYQLADLLSYLVFMNLENYNLKIMSTIDAMTNTYTRKYFDIIINDIMYNVKINGERFALLMIDIDKFKDINDTYGHRKGDEALSKIGNTLVQNVRSTDIVARYGGEEFIVILQNTSERDAKEVAEKLRKKIEELNIENSSCLLTVSIGISIFPDHSQFKEELIEEADQALYCAKENGRNRVEAWNSNIVNSFERVDRLAGIVTGNTVQDQRNVLALMDMVDLLRKDNSLRNKIYEFLGRTMEILSAENIILFTLSDSGKIEKSYSRKRFTKGFSKIPYYNKEILEKTIESKKGEFLIDWEDIGDVDALSGIPNWKSIVVFPLIYKGIMKGIVYLSVPLKEKEFDYNSYNFIKAICSIFSPLLN